MDVTKNKKVAYCVDFVTVHHFTKCRSHIYNIGDFMEGGTLCPPPPVLQGSKKPGINKVKIAPLSQPWLNHGVKTCLRTGPDTAVWNQA